MITISNLTVKVAGKTLVDNVSFAAEKGEWLCIIGPNGAGKTTLLRAICGLIDFTGSAQAGIDVSKASPRDIARSVSYCPQEALLPPHMTVLQYVLLGRAAFHGWLGLPSKEDHTIARESLAQVDAGPLTLRKLGTLSGGERRRVTVAQALAQRAPVMLLDEPVASLDIGHQQQLLELLDSLRKSAGLTLVTTAHDLTLAGQYGDQLLLLRSGSVAVCGTPVEVLRAEVLAQHYGAHVSIASAPDGRVIVTPVRPSSSITPP